MAAEEFAEESLFLRLFHQICERRNKDHASDDEVRESVYNFIDYFKMNRSAAGACDVDNLQSNADFWGCFYWLSPLSAAVTRNKTLEAIRDCEKFRSCFNQRSLKIVSVGGGTGSDLVGLYSAIYKNSVFQDMVVHLIDNIDEWKILFQKVHKLLSEEDFGYASQLLKTRRCSHSYICADMRNEVIPECREALKEADLVWMKGFLSTLANDSERYDVTQAIISSMTRGALLVVMEPPPYDQFNDFVERNLLKRLYSTRGGYTLGIVDSIPKFRIQESTNMKMIIFETL